MRLRIVGILLLLGVVWPAAHAQHWGVKLGASYSELREETNGLASLLGFNAGVSVAVPVSGTWSALAEGNLYRKGYDAGGEWRDAQNLVIGSDPEKQVDYVSALAAVRYQAPWGRSGLEFFALLGPRVDVLIGDRFVATVDGRRETVELPDGFGLPPFNSAVFGVSAGVGIDLTNAVSIPLLVELRYNADATVAWKSSDVSDFRYRTFDLRVGYTF